MTQQTRVTVEFRRQGGDGEEDGRIRYALEKEVKIEEVEYAKQRKYTGRIKIVIDHRRWALRKQET